MTRQRKPKPSALDRRLQHHDRMCTRFIYSDPDRMNKCSCGRDAAILELAELRRRAARNEALPMFAGVDS